MNASENSELETKETRKWNNLETKHSFTFKDSKRFVKVHNKQTREIIESGIISNHNTMKPKARFFINLSSYFVKLVLNNCNILYLN